MKVLVTGATGFIGQYVVEEMLRNEQQVIASSADLQKAEQAPWFNRVTYIPLNFVDFDASVDYYNFFNQPDLLIHLAWEGLPNYKSAFHEEINLPRHLAFLTNLVQHGLKDITVTGTCFEYGMQEGELSENMPALPDNPYGKAKDGLRKGLEALQKKLPFSFKWTRLFYMYGKGQNPNSLLSQLDNALSNGEKTFNMSGGQQLRDYLPVEKVAENIVRIALQKEVDGVINNCSGRPVTVEAFVLDYLAKNEKQIILNTGYYPYSDYEPMHFWGDTKKLKKILHDE
ncbi:MAG: NAD(P)-dependent oxidoreductase [Bacteroidota bacterium]|nr:NAD(P)-dependent oxidoreductase [Bacteroidota bacterium]